MSCEMMTNYGYRVPLRVFDNQIFSAPFINLLFELATLLCTYEPLFNMNRERKQAH